MFKAITPIVATLIGILVFFYYIKPTMDEVSAIQAETEEYADAVRNAGEFNNTLQSLVQKKNSFSALEIDRLEALVPDDVNEVKLLVDLKEMAVQHNMLFGNVSVNEGDDLGTSQGGSALDIEEDFTSSDISFSLIGTYDQFKALLADIERSLVLMEVTDISFSSEIGNLQQYGVTIRTYALLPLDE